MNKARERKKRARRLKSHRPSQGISAKLGGEKPGPRVSAGGEQVAPRLRVGRQAGYEPGRES